MAFFIVPHATVGLNIVKFGFAWFQYCFFMSVKFADALRDLQCCPFCLLFIARALGGGGNKQTLISPDSSDSERCC